MEFLSKKTEIDFMKHGKFWIVVSLLMVAFSVYVWFAKGDDKYGIDFRGGVNLVVQFKEPIDAGAIRSSLESVGISDAVVQSFEKASNQFSIRLISQKSGEADAGAIAKKALESLQGNTATILLQDSVGPVIGEKVKEEGLLAVILSLAAILIYVGIRFEWRFAGGAVIALLHDVTIMVGVYLLSGREVNSGLLAAVLTIIGFSVNDTIVIFDRVRENMTKAYRSATKKRSAKKGEKQTSSSEVDYGSMTLTELFNASVNETLGRTILTGVTALFSSATLWLFGGGALSDLAFALTIGMAVGMYSTVFIASPYVIAWEKNPKQKLSEKV